MSDAAILMMLLAEEQAADIVAELAPGEIERLGAAMVAMNAVEPAAAEGALDRFVAAARASAPIDTAGDVRTRAVFSRAIGVQRADALVARLAPDLPTGQIAPLKWMGLDAVADIVRAEAPQAGAAILADLEPARAAALLARLPVELQDELVQRVSRMAAPAPFAFAALAPLLTERVERPASPPVDRDARVASVAAIVAKMARSADQALLKSIGRRDKALAQRISDELFIFADLLRLPPKELSLVVRATDADMLALALKGIDEAQREAVLAGLSGRAADAVRDDIAERGPVPAAEVEAAQRAMVATVRRLEREGALAIGQQDAAYV